MRRALILAAAAAATLGGCGRNADEAAPPVAQTPTDLRANEAAPVPAGGFATSADAYVEQAGAGDAYEISSSRLAMQKTSNADVRAFAQMLAADHARSAAQLIPAAAQARPPIRATPAMTPGQQANLAVLGRANRGAFDRAFLTQQVDAHQQALALVQGYAQNGTMPSLRQHAAQSAPVIQQHLERAQALLAALGG